MPTNLTPEELQTWLEWASARLLATPSQRIKPQEPGVLWPAYSQDKFEILDFRAGIALRALAPSSAEIPIMDEILLLPNLCTTSLSRRAIRLRSLVNPLTGSHLYKWHEIASKLETKQYTTRHAYQVGLTEIIKRTPRPTIARIGIFMDANEGVYVPAAKI